MSDTAAYAPRAQHERRVGGTMRITARALGWVALVAAAHPALGAGAPRFGSAARLGAQEAAPATPPLGLVRGHVLGQGPSDPLAGALIYVSGLTITALADSSGAYRLPLPEGAWVVSVYHVRAAELGLEDAPSALVTVVAGDTTLADFTVVEEALGTQANPFRAEGLRVLVGRRVEDRKRSEGGRIDVVDFDEIAERVATARNLADVIRGTFPSLRIRKPGAGELCVETRRVTTQPIRAGGDCTGMVAVVLDGVLVFDPEHVLPTIPPRDVKRVEFINAILAGARYGTLGGNGVLVIYTR